MWGPHTSLSHTHSPRYELEGYLPGASLEASDTDFRLHVQQTRLLKGMDIRYILELR
jgi:hypothetical protein